MKIRRVIAMPVALLTTLLLVAPVTGQAVEKIPVVASFSILGDMTSRIGGEHIALTTLVGANGDTHVYQPTPAAARAVSMAKLMIVNGLEFEGWLARLVKASGFSGNLVVATRGIEPMAYADGDEHHGEKSDATDEHHDNDHKGTHDKKAHGGDEHNNEAHGHTDEHGHHHGAFDPHAWQSLQLAITYVDNITAALAKASPANASRFYQNRAEYVTELKALDARIRQDISGLAANQRTVVTSHDAFQYFARDYGLTFLAPQGLSTESEASAKGVSALIKQMRAERISAVFLENISDPRLLKQIANETGATIGGTLYPGALSDSTGPAPTYLDMMRHNAATLVKALSRN